MIESIEEYRRKLEAVLADTGPVPWRDTAAELLRERLMDRPHGDLPAWEQALSRLPQQPTPVRTDTDTVTVGEPGVLAADERDALEQGLRGLIPWRKGPFRFFDVEVDTEWRSDWKWQRIVPHMGDLAGRRVLDVGCGSGYHCWRLHGAGAAHVLGIDPGILFLCQFLAVKRYVPEHPVWYLPARLEELPPSAAFFDTVLSLGVLYHRRSPLEHLLQLRETLRPGGELVLETLVVEGDERTCLVPEGRYAAMRNVWFLPSTAMLENWLRRTGFTDPVTVDVTATTVEEQRPTAWMPGHSLPQFLDPEDHRRTREGHPAPLRATMVAHAR